MSQDLVEAIKAAMRPLVVKYSLRIAGEVDDGNYSAVEYVNGSTGLKVAVDWSELRPFLSLHRLTGGAFPSASSDTGVPPVTMRHAFDVDDLLLLRSPRESPVGKMFPKRDEAAAALLLSEYATALDENASDVLNGEFAVFEELNRIVNDRAMRLHGGR